MFLEKIGIYCCLIVCILIEEWCQMEPLSDSIGSQWNNKKNEEKKEEKSLKSIRWNKMSTNVIVYFLFPFIDSNLFNGLFRHQRLCEQWRNTIYAPGYRLSITIKRQNVFPFVLCWAFLLHNGMVHIIMVSTIFTVVAWLLSSTVPFNFNSL